MLRPVDQQKGRAVRCYQVPLPENEAAILVLLESILPVRPSHLKPLEGIPQKSVGRVNGSRVTKWPSPCLGELPGDGPRTTRSGLIEVALP